MAVHRRGHEILAGSPSAKAANPLQERLRPIFAAATGHQVGHDVRDVLLHPGCFEKNFKSQ